MDQLGTVDALKQLGFTLLSDGNKRIIFSRKIKRKKEFLFASIFPKTAQISLTIRTSTPIHHGQNRKLCTPKAVKFGTLDHEALARMSEELEISVRNQKHCKHGGKNGVKPHLMIATLGTNAKTAISHLCVDVRCPTNGGQIKARRIPQSRAANAKRMQQNFLPRIRQVAVVN